MLCPRWRPGFVYIVVVMGMQLLGGIHLLGNLVNVVTRLAQQMNHLLELRNIKLYHQPIYGHFAQIGFPVLCAQLLHFEGDEV